LPSAASALHVLLRIELSGRCRLLLLSLNSPASLIKSDKIPIITKVSCPSAVRNETMGRATPFTRPPSLSVNNRLDKVDKVRNRSDRIAKPRAFLPSRSEWRNLCFANFQHTTDMDASLTAALGSRPSAIPLTCIALKNRVTTVIRPSDRAREALLADQYDWSKKRTYFPRRYSGPPQGLLKLHSLMEEWCTSVDLYVTPVSLCDNPRTG